ncbi:hemolysin expression modulator Hha (plasmid) [Erwinia pyri]|uniref:Hemolysin expression modulator Hha n=1 Tax=Erwinia pyri TaxID=3062598 RepID=A0AA50HNL7_9GAMM|nr:hemolysin expression modulator Hha [Erwinia sp. DE2]WLS81213.1 hemolysin expression modulator Hha [Erwinia sp. DE2]
MKTRQDWLYQLRKCQHRETLEKIIEKNEHCLTADELVTFYSAADHRLAEIVMDKLFDKVPASVWQYVK